MWLPASFGRVSRRMADEGVKKAVMALQRSMLSEDSDAAAINAPNHMFWYECDLKSSVL